MRKSLLLFVTLCSLSLTAQVKQEVPKGLPFADLLSVVKSKDSIKYGLQEIAALHKELITADTLTSDTNTFKWKLIYYQNAGWSEVLPRPQINYNQLFVVKKEKTFSAQEIFSECGIDNPGDSKLKTSVLMAGRGSWRNVFSNEKHLMIRFVWSYPNGNQTSGYSERTYYFERVNSF